MVSCNPNLRARKKRIYKVLSFFSYHVSMYKRRPYFCTKVQILLKSMEKFERNKEMLSVKCFVYK